MSYFEQKLREEVERSGLGDSDLYRCYLAWYDDDIYAALGALVYVLGLRPDL